MLYLRTVKDLRFNPKRVYRIDRELEWHLRIKPNKCLVREKPEPLRAPRGVNDTGSMDFMHERLADGGRVRLCNGLR